MAEVVAGIALVSSIAQLLDFGSRIIGRVADYQKAASGASSVHKALENKLPIVEDILKQIRENAQHGEVNAESRKLLIPVILDCHSYIGSLEYILRKVVPRSTDDRRARVPKAVMSIMYESKIDELMSKLTETLRLLVIHTSFHTRRVPPLLQAVPQPIIQVAAPKQKRVVSLPFQRDVHYLDRPEIMLAVEAAMASHHRAVLSGLGGVGKSQIAIEYCYLFKDTSPDAHVIWVHISTIERLVHGWSQMARQLNIPGHDKADVDMLQLVQEYLSNEDCNPWLLVLDNADDEDVVISSPADVTGGQHDFLTQSLVDSLPCNEHGRILITTRDRRVGLTLAEEESIVDVPSLGHDEALRMFQSKIPEPLWDETSAGHVVKELDYIPLAINQAAAYIGRKRISIRVYSELLRTDTTGIQSLLESQDKRRDREIRVPILRTWKLSFDMVRRHNPLATDILAIMATMDRQSVPKSLLRRSDENELEFLEALAALQAFSIISATDTGEMFSMHRLVQLSVKAKIDQAGDLQRVQKIALERLIREIPEDTTFETWGSWDAIVPHIEALLLCSIESVAGRLQQAQLLCSIAAYDQEQGRYEWTKRRLDQSLLVRKRVLKGEGKEDDAGTIACLSQMGHLMTKKSKYVEAVALHREVHERCVRTFGEDDPLTLKGLSDLGGSLWWDGKHAEAIEIQAKVLGMREQTLGSDHSETLKSMHDLAAIHEADGDHVKAETLLRRVLEINLNTAGTSNAAITESQRRLAFSLQSQAKMDEAEDIFRAALASGKQGGREKHPDVLVLQDFLAGCLYWRGKFVEAEIMQREAWMTRVEVLPAKHPSTLRSAQLLSGILEGMQRYDEQKSLLDQLIDDQTETLGQDHVDTLKSMALMAQNLHKKGDLVASEEMYCWVHEAKTRTLGHSHPETLQTLDQIAGILWVQEDHAGALEVQQEALLLRQGTRGDSHPETLSSKDTVIGSRWGQNDLPGATLMLRDALRLREDKYGSADPETLIRMTRPAYLLRIQDQKSEAIELYQRALELYEQTLGPDDETTRECACNVTDTIAEQVALSVSV